MHEYEHNGINTKAFGIGIFIVGVLSLAKGPDPQCNGHQLGVGIPYI